MIEIKSLSQKQETLCINKPLENRYNKTLEKLFFIHSTNLEAILFAVCIGGVDKGISVFANLG